MSSSRAKLLLLGIIGIFLTTSQVLANNTNKKMTGTLVVVNKLADTVSLIDVASQQVVKTLATGKGPHELAISEDGLWAVTTDYVGGNSLTVIDVANAKVARSISLSKYSRPHGILFLADQTRVAVSSEGSDSAVVVNIHTGNIETAISTKAKGSHMVAVVPKSNLVYTTNMGSDSVSELSVDDGSLTRNLPMPETPEALTVNDSGSELWVGSNKQGLLSIFKLSDLTLLAQFSDYTFPYRILLTDDQAFAVVPDYRQDTFDVYNAQTKTRFSRLNLAADSGPKGVHFHPNDRTAFLALHKQDKVVAIDILSQQVLMEFPTGDGPDGIGYSAVELVK